MKQLAWEVLAECLKQTRSKTEPRTRTRTQKAFGQGFLHRTVSRAATLPRRPATLAGPMQDKP